MKAIPEHIGLFDVDSHTVILVSRYIRIARAEEGADLKLTNSNILQQVFDHSAKTENLRLKIIFLSLHNALKERFGDQVGDLYKKDTPQRNKLEPRTVWN